MELEGKEADRFLRKMIAKEKSPPTKKEKEIIKALKEMERIGFTVIMKKGISKKKMYNLMEKILKDKNVEKLEGSVVL